MYSGKDLLKIQMGVSWVQVCTRTYDNLSLTFHR